MKFIVLSKKDNVATALIDLQEKCEVKLELNEKVINIKEFIQFGHKFAIKDIAIGENIFKYGEIIGRAISEIKCGEHVHVHNLEGTRGRGDL